EQPSGSRRATALFAHCFTCSKDIAAATRISRELSERGIAVLRFDFTGLGHSEGEFANTNFSSNTEDLVSAADHLREHADAPTLLIGHSLGGAAVLRAAPRIPEVRAVATIGAPAELGHVRRLIRSNIDEIEEKGHAVVNLSGRTFTISKQFLDDIATQDLSERIRTMQKALLIFHAPADDIVQIDSARRIFEAARHPKSFISLDSADHLLTRKQDSQYVANTIAAWAGRYIPVAEIAAKDTTRPKLKSGEVLVRETDGKFGQDVFTDSHHVLADEPTRNDGRDTGPDPYEFLLAALGTCISMTARMYASHKKLPLEKVSVKLSHSRIHAEDCEHCETKDGKIDRIESELVLEGDLTAEQRQRVLEISNKCPVHRTLHSEIDVQTRLA
ncbi:MAG: alpha/beta fold hydrolase, partial [Proteobacteria bacterium]|nr:alpha/beta fold hydrolase [Pseudomonadota bacterium]